jgi:hypothetical protein
MADLNALMQVAPITAGGFAGIDQAQNERYNDLRAQELGDLMQQRRAQEARIAELQPLVMQQHQATIQGLQNNNKITGVNANIAEATLPDVLAQKKAESHGAMIGRTFQTLGEMADTVSDPNEVEKALDDISVPANVKQMIMGHLSNLQGPALQQEMKRLQGNFLKANPHYVQAMDVANVHEKGQTERNAATNASAERRAVTLANARKKQIDDLSAAMEQAFVTAKGAKNQHSAALAAEEWFNGVGDEARSKKYHDLAEQLRNQAETEINNTAPPPGKPALKSFGIQTNPNRSIAPSPKAGASAPAAAPAASGDTVRVLAPDGKTKGTLPASKLKEALARGYKRIE